MLVPQGGIRILTCPAYPLDDFVLHSRSMEAGLIYKETVAQLLIVKILVAGLQTFDRTTQKQETRKTRMKRITPFALVFIAAMFVCFTSTEAQTTAWDGGGVGGASMLSSMIVASALPLRAEENEELIPISFNLKEPAIVTVVIDRPDGTRVRNLINAEPFPAGKNTVSWDGLDEGVIRPEGNSYTFRRSLVDPGSYTARIITHSGLNPHYEFTVYPNTGNPPWTTPEEISGGWLADHSAPCAVLFVPAANAPGGEDRVLILSDSAEAGDGLVWVDLEGNKKAGFRTIKHGVNDTHLALDCGAKAPKDAAVYMGGGGWDSSDDKQQGLIIVKALTINSQDQSMRGRVAGYNDYYYRPVLTLPVENSKIVLRGKPRAKLRGLAVHDGILLALVDDSDELIVARVSGEPSKRDDTAEILGRISVPGIDEIAFDNQGRMVALVGNMIKRFQLDLDSDPTLKAEETVVSGMLEAPVRISIGKDGRIFVSDAGNSHQVKIFSTTGKPEGVVGKPGAPTLGPYDPLHLNDPAGMSVDSCGNLWVAERHREPKRISVWANDGSLLKSFIGPAKYGGGGSLDPRDRTIMYVGQKNALLKFRLDWEKGQSELVAVPYRMQIDEPPFFFSNFKQSPQDVFYSGSQRFLTDGYSSGPVSGGRLITLWSEDAGQILRPLAIVGAAKYWPLLTQEKFLKRIPNESVSRKTNRETGEEDISIRAIVAWSDWNGNGLPEPEEMTFLPLDNKEPVRSVIVDNNLNFWIVTSARLFKLPPDKGESEAAPFYDLARAEVVATKENGFPSGNGQIHASDGSNIMIGGPIVGLRPDGSRWWQYHSQWPSLHAGHGSPRQPEYPGQLLATTRALGWPQDLPEPALGQVWGINSNYGVMYYFTTDGMFLGTVGGFRPEATGWNMPNLKRNASMKTINFSSEHFYPTFTRTSDGKYYMVAGMNHVSIVRVDGFDTIRRLPDQKLDVTAAQLRKLIAYNASSRDESKEEAGEKILSVPIELANRETRANPDDWEGVPWVTVEQRNVSFSSFAKGTPFPWSEVAVMVAGDRLHFAVRTHEPDLLTNAANNPPFLFKTGGALDIQLGTNPKAPTNRKAPVEGDIRILIAQDLEGKPIAMLYEPVSPSAAKSGLKPEVFSSPLREIPFDRVVEISDVLKMKNTKHVATLVSPKNKNKTKTLGKYIWEASVPLSSIGLKHVQGLSIRADLGVLIGSGGETVQRTYWSNKKTGLISDIPSEAELLPARWGTFHLNKPKTTGKEKETL